MNMMIARMQIFYVLSQLRSEGCSNDEYHRQDKTSAAIFEEPYGAPRQRNYLPFLRYHGSGLCVNT